MTIGFQCQSVLFCYEILKTIGFVCLLFYEISKTFGFVTLRDFNFFRFSSAFLGYKISMTVGFQCQLVLFLHYFTRFERQSVLFRYKISKMVYFVRL